MVVRKVPMLLVVMSIVLMIGAILELLAGLLGALAGTALIGFGVSSGVDLLAAVGTAVIILSMAAGVLQLLMGIFGIRGQHLTFCLVMAIIVVVLNICSLFIGGSVFMQVLSIIVSSLYLLGVIAAIQQAGQPV